MKICFFPKRKSQNPTISKRKIKTKLTLLLKAQKMTHESELINKRKYQ